MEKHYCSVHGEYRIYGWETGGCPDCKSEKARAESDRAESIEASKRTADNSVYAAYLTNNPGDYECPECRMVSLKNYASRCPLCRAEISRVFWEQIRERERLAENKRIQDETERQQWLASPEYAEKIRQDAERKATEQAQRERQEQDIKSAKRSRRMLARFILIGTFLPLCLYFNAHPDQELLMFPAGIMIISLGFWAFWYSYIK